MSEHHIKSALQIMKSRSDNHFDWIDQARQANEERSFFKKVLGIGKISAEGLMIQEAEEMRRKRAWVPRENELPVVEPLVGMLQYVLRGKGKTPMIMRGELRGNPDEARRFALEHVLAIQQRAPDIEVVDPIIDLPNNTTVDWMDFVAPVENLQQK